jgi:hypothetical protein
MKVPKNDNIKFSLIGRTAEDALRPGLRAIYKQSVVRFMEFYISVNIHP